MGNESTVFLTAKVLGAKVRSERISSGLTLQETAGLCNVGARFLFDLEAGKPTVQMDMAMKVAHNLGISLTISGDERSGICSRPPMTACRTISTVAPTHDTGHWLTVNRAAWLATRCGGADLWQQEVRPTENAIIYTTVKGGVYPFEGAIDEATGGPGYASIFRFINSRSAVPAVDKRTVIRVAVATTLFADDLVQARDFFFVDQADGRLSLNGVPYIRPVTALFGAPGTGGLRIAGEAPSEWLRADHFVSFAETADVKPRIVFDIMKHQAETLHLEFERSLYLLYKASSLRGAAAEALRLVQNRSLRMRELISMAGSQGLSGIKTQRKIFIEKPVEPETRYTGHETLYD